MSGAFSFRDRWTVAAPADRVHALLVDLEHYPDWWPQVLAVAKLDDDHARVLCRSALPYTLDLVLAAVSREPGLLAVDVGGDLVGSVRWRLEGVAGGTRLDLEQDVVVTGRWRGPAAGLLRPLLVWNHDRMMAGCLTGLKSRLDG